MADQRLRFLADASMLLASSVEIRETLETLAGSIVPRIADWCTIALREVDGKVRRVAGVHADPARAAAMADYLGGFPPEEHRTSSMTEAVQQGKSFFLPHVPHSDLVAVAQNAAHLKILETLGCTSSIVVPLIARGQTIGAISLVMSDDRRVFDELDHQLARELGALTGLAIDNARRSAENQDLLHRAEAAIRAKDEFLAILGHELRNPLAPIVTALELMRHRPNAAERELAVIERQTRHLVKLVDDLLDVARITRGRVALEREPLEVADVVEKSIEMAERLFEERDQRLTVTVPRDLVVSGDPTRLAQVFANLLTNAATYTPKGGAVEVIARRVDTRIVIVVRDTGVGIAPGILPHVFDMFVQDRQPLDRSRGGLGLGLAIVKNLVEAHGGTVVARSEGLGRGSELEVALPAATCPIIVAPPPATELRGGARILVVDDNEDAAELLAEALDRSGYVTRVANDALHALDAYRDFDPAAAILDIGLPVIDGYELARRIRALPGGCDVHLIAVTGYGQPSDRERAASAGFDRHLVKPVSIATIRGLLDAALQPSSGIPAAT